jgi:hypothetical protein
MMNRCFNKETQEKALTSLVMVSGVHWVSFRSQRAAAPGSGDGCFGPGRPKRLRLTLAETSPRGRGLEATFRTAIAPQDGTQ